jgi:CheY-like chemotaxis protein
MSLHILMAEDDPDIQLVAGLALRKAGFTVTIVNTGLELLRALETETPDAVILDWMMPDMDGPDTLERLRQDERTRDLPVIFMTAKSQGFEVERGRALGAAGYIIKPFDVFKLGDQVNEILGR